MFVALGFAPNEQGFSVVEVSTNDVEAAKTKLETVFERTDFVRVILLESASPIAIIGNWKAPFNFRNASLAQIEALMG